MDPSADGAVRLARVQSVLSLVRALARRPVALIAAVGLAAGLVARSDVIFLATLLVGGVPLVLQTLRGFPS